MLLLLFLLSVCAIDMRDFTVGSFEASVFRQREVVGGHSCQSPGGIVNQIGDCVCCPGWSGIGCSTRNRCFDISCANGGHCNPDTGFCSCPKTHTGPQCENPSCSFHGYYDIKKKHCVCNAGFAGIDCEQCAVAPMSSQVNVCVPSPQNVYILMTLPISFAAQLVSGEKKPSPTVTYNAIYPNSIGKDGKHYGCDCRAESAENRKRWISNGNLFLYNETIVTCVAESTLTTQQMSELINMWYTAYTLEQQGRLNDTWYILGIVFMVLFAVTIFILIIYCIVQYYNRTTTEFDEETPIISDTKSQYVGRRATTRKSRVK